MFTMSNNHLIRKHSLGCERCRMFRRHVSARAAAAEEWWDGTSYHDGAPSHRQELPRSAFGLMGCCTDAVSVTVCSVTSS
jgi:hypothetical protein